jgi:DNA mismatch repair protein MutS2
VLLREAETAKLKEKLEREGLTEMHNRTRELEVKLNTLLKDFEYQARETVKLVEDRAQQQKLSKEAERRIARMRREFQESFNSAVVAHNTGADVGDPNATPHIIRHVAVGDTVKLRKLGKTGQVVRAIDANFFEIAVGPMKMRVSRNDLSEVTPAPVVVAPPQTPLRAMSGRRGITVQMSAGGDADSLSSEINVIGRNAEEAREEVERYLDRAFLAGLPRIRIVHGTGMGVLRRTLRQWLNSHPQVETVTEPPQNEGGAGATVVELKQ